MLSAEALEICTILLMENLQATTQGIVRPSILGLPSKFDCLLSFSVFYILVSFLWILCGSVIAVVCIKGLVHLATVVLLVTVQLNKFKIFMCFQHNHNLVPCSTVPSCYSSVSISCVCSSLKPVHILLLQCTVRLRRRLRGHSTFGARLASKFESSARQQQLDPTQNTRHRTPTENASFQSHPRVQHTGLWVLPVVWYILFLPANGNRVQFQAKPLYLHLTERRLKFYIWNKRIHTMASSFDAQVEKSIPAEIHMISGSHDSQSKCFRWL